MKKHLILVDEKDRPTGKMEKLLVHKQGLLHRAFSVFIFNSRGELLLQQRSANKYHSEGLWSNTCCSHPQFGEDTREAAIKRLKEEMGITCNITFMFSFIYKAEFKNGLTEHEFDHVFFGITDDPPSPNREEVTNYEYISMDNLEKEIKTHPEKYTEWLKICFPEVNSKSNN